MFLALRVFYGHVRGNDRRDTWMQARYSRKSSRQSSSTERPLRYFSEYHV